jgi:hypothetical protein
MIFLSIFIKSLGSAAFQMLLQYLLFMIIFVIAILSSPHGLISSIIATIPLALMATMTVTGVLFTFYFLLVGPAIQFYLSWKEFDNRGLEKGEIASVHWQYARYGLSFFNAGLLSVLILSFVFQF